MTKDPLLEAVTPETKWYVVLRPFDGDHRYTRGEVVDTSGWTHRVRLEDQRYVAPLPHGAEVPEPDSDGFRFLTLDAEQEQKVPAKKRPVTQKAAKKQTGKRPTPTRK